MALWSVMQLERGGVLVLTGAGISAESGIPTFRDANGLWENHAVEDVASPEGWARDPALVWRFYALRRAGAARCAPNEAHHALARLERKLGARLLVATQNVDALHEHAGSTRVAHVHGELERSRCSAPDCGAPSFPDARSYPSLDEVPPCERCGAPVRPDIVWFGEVPMHLDTLHLALRRCATFVAIGTSGLVWPVAGFVRFLREARPDVRTIYVGPEAPANAEWFDEHRLERATVAVPALCEELAGR